MNNSNDDVYTITIDSSTITSTDWTSISLNDNMNNSIIVQNVPIETITIDSSTFSGTTFNWSYEEFVDCMPDMYKIKSMCERYPALDVAFKNFKTIYEMVKDDYDAENTQK